MSAGVGIWRQTLSRAARLPLHKEELETPVVATEDQLPVSSLVRQLFFSGIPRKKVFLAAPDRETKVYEIGEAIGRSLAEMSGATVAWFTPAPQLEPTTSLKKRPRGVGDEFWVSSGVELAKRLWRIPSSLLASIAKGDGPIAWGEIPFDYVLCAGAVSDGLTPWLCRVCDGAVLVLTAHRTRRDSALRAKEVLRQFNADLLGTVLEGRRFPIPESIYRRL